MDVVTQTEIWLEKHNTWVHVTALALFLEHCYLVGIYIVNTGSQSETWDDKLESYFRNSLFVRVCLSLNIPFLIVRLMAWEWSFLLQKWED